MVTTKEYYYVRELVATRISSTTKKCTETCAAKLLFCWDKETVCQ